MILCGRIVLSWLTQYNGDIFIFWGGERYFLRATSSMWALALVASVKKPWTRSRFRRPYPSIDRGGILLSADLDGLTINEKVSVLRFHCTGIFPISGIVFKRCALVAESNRSLTATTSSSQHAAP